MTNRSIPDGTEEALRRIAIAKDMRSLFLELQGLGLTKLPPEIGSLTTNQLSTMSPEIGSRAEVRAGTRKPGDG
jgi:hypothetical protein